MGWLGGPVFHGQTISLKHTILVNVVNQNVVPQVSFWTHSLVKMIINDNSDYSDSDNDDSNDDNNDDVYFGSYLFVFPATFGGHPSLCRATSSEAH